MFDRLLGRAELQERIEELEEERTHLERQLEAEQERRAEAQSARQEAERRVNRLEDRIADLEGQLDQARDQRARDEQGGHRRRAELGIAGGRLTAVLDRLDSVAAPGEGALTACVDPAADVPDPVRTLLGGRAGLLPDARTVVYADDAGLVAAALVAPLAPAPFVEWGDRFRVDRTWFDPTAAGAPDRYALALVRSDTFAVGTYEGTERVAVDGFETDVQGDHSKGGFSQARFERRRDEQIADHLDRCATALADAPRPLYLTGERQLLGRFEAEADAVRAVDATGAPESALADAFDAFWTTRLYGL